MRETLGLAIAGAAGTLARWVLSGWTYRLLGAGFAYGTLLVNVFGCLLLGAVVEILLLTDLVPPSWRPTLTVGFLGAFTTFSTFAYETMRYVEDGAWWLAMANVGTNVALGLGAIWLGFMAARAAIGGT